MTTAAAGCARARVLRVARSQFFCALSSSFIECDCGDVRKRSLARSPARLLIAPSLIYLTRAASLPHAPLVFRRRRRENRRSLPPDAARVATKKQLL